jgi:hypothetical protein
MPFWMLRDGTLVYRDDESGEMPETSIRSLRRSGRVKPQPPSAAGTGPLEPPAPSADAHAIVEDPGPGVETEDQPMTDQIPCRTQAP